MGISRITVSLLRVRWLWSEGEGERLSGTHIYRPEMPLLRLFLNTGERSIPFWSERRASKYNGKDYQD
jgi:hypothetical protein